jgi:uncharacterized protein
MTDSPRNVFARFQDAMLAFSADDFADLFTTDAQYEFACLAPHRQTSRYDGREAIRAGFRQAWSSVNGRGVAAFREVRIHETTDPEVLIAEADLDAMNPETGRTFLARFVAILRVRDGQIVHLREYADVLRVFRGLGRLPDLYAALESSEVD